MFLGWAATKLGYEEWMGQFAWTVAHAKWFRKQDAWGTKPEPGAFVFFDWGGSDSIARIDHVGVVTKVAGGRIHTIEGNIDGGVAKRKVRDTGKVVGYGYPWKIKERLDAEAAQKAADEAAAMEAKAGVGTQDGSGLAIVVPHVELDGQQKVPSATRPEKEQKKKDATPPKAGKSDTGKKSEPAPQGRPRRRRLSRAEVRQARQAHHGRHQRRHHRPAARHHGRLRHLPVRHGRLPRAAHLRAGGRPRRAGGGQGQDAAAAARPGRSGGRAGLRVPLPPPPQITQAGPYRVLSPAAGADGAGGATAAGRRRGAGHRAQVPAGAVPPTNRSSSRRRPASSTPSPARAEPAPAPERPITLVWEDDGSTRRLITDTGPIEIPREPGLYELPDPYSAFHLLGGASGPFPIREEPVLPLASANRGEPVLPLAAPRPRGASTPARLRRRPPRPPPPRPPGRTVPRPPGGASHGGHTPARPPPPAVRRHPAPGAVRPGRPAPRPPPPPARPGSRHPARPHPRSVPECPVRARRPDLHTDVRARPDRHPTLSRPRARRPGHPRHRRGSQRPPPRPPPRLTPRRPRPDAPSAGHGRPAVDHFPPSAPTRQPLI
ncbi:CHAP domain-containing protein [Nonomuraea ferruginea]